MCQGTLCSALVLAALRAPSRRTRSPSNQEPKWIRRTDRAARHGVFKSATTKINYKMRRGSSWQRCMLTDRVGSRWIGELALRRLEVNDPRVTSSNPSASETSSRMRSGGAAHSPPMLNTDHQQVPKQSI
jgi:hypothetical protein